MSAHEIVWTFDTDTVKPEVVCNAPKGADCRLGPQSYNECQCESWNILRDDDSAPYHYADGGDRAIGDRHYMTDHGECNVVTFLENSDCIEESCDLPHATFVIGRTPIAPVWQGDYYDWKPAEVTD